MQDTNLFWSFLTDYPLLSGIIAIVMVEIVYLILIKTNKREYKESLLEFTLSYKVLAIFLTFVGGCLILGLFYLLPEILFLVGILGIVAIYIGINYLVAKYGSKTETKEEYDKRLKEEAKKHAHFPFKVGDKIRCKKAYDSEYRISNSDARLQVEKIDYESEEDDLKIRVLSHKTRPSTIGDEYWVSSGHFEKLRRKK